MATKLTGRAASIARNNVRKSNLPTKPKKLVTPSPQPTVAGATTTARAGGSARGDDFAGSFGGSDTSTPVRTTNVSTTPRTRSQLRNATFDLAGGGRTTTVDKVRQDSLRREKQKKDKERRERMRKGGRLATDNLRASEQGLVSQDSTTTKGGRSSAGITQPRIKARITTKDGLKKIIYADGTSEYDETPDSYYSKLGITQPKKALSDKQVADLASQGYMEGDFVPGRGQLLPNGTFDTSRIDAINKIKEQTDAVVARYNTLKGNEATAADNIIATDESVVQEEKQSLDSVAEAAKNNPLAQTLSLLDSEIKDIKTGLRDDIKEINRQAKQSQSNLEGKQAQETGQQSVQLAEAGGYLGYSGSGQGVMLKLAESHRAELSALDVARQKAINDARVAAANRQYDVVKEKAAYVAQIEEQAYKAQLDYESKVKAQAEKEKDKLDEMETQNDIFRAIKEGNKSPEDIFAALNGVVDVETINKFLTGISKGVEGAFKFSATNNAALLGSGLSADDIQALNEYVNENGYDEKVRGTLTPTQRAAADKIFRTSLATGGSSAPLDKPLSLLELGRIEDYSGVKFPIGVTQAEVTQFLNDNAGASPEELQQALDESLGVGGGTEDSGLQIDVSKDWLTSNLSLEQQKKLADLVGASSWWTGKQTDVNRMFDDPGLMQSLSNKFEELRKEGFSDQDILDALTS